TIYDSKIVGLQAGRNPSLFEFLEEALVELAVGVNVPLQKCVLDRALVEFIRLLLLLIKSGMKHVFTLQGRIVLAADLGDDFLHFPLDLGIDLFELVADLIDLGVRRSELRTQFRGLNFEISLFAAQGVQQASTGLLGAESIFDGTGISSDGVRIS